ncbi:MAG: ABC transporter ATP-binding protein [Clostridia bacterium]|nr:ABC transporter ATP-binding protein [Clostridia bacterium]
MIGEVLGDLCLPYLMSYIVNFGVEGYSPVDPEHGSPLAAKLIDIFLGADATRMEIIILFGILMLCVTLVGGFFGTFCAYTAAKASQGFGNDLRRDAYSRVMSLSVEQTDKFTTGSLVTRMTNDITILVEFVEHMLRMVVRSPMFFIGGTVMLLSLNVRFGLVLLCTLPLQLFAMVFVIRKAVPLFSEVQKKLDRINSVARENISGARVIKAYVREDYECERFEGANSEMRDTNLKVQLLLTFINPILIVSLAFATVAIIYIGGLQTQIEASGMTTGTVMAAITYVTQVVNSLMMLTMIFQTISRAGASSKRIVEVLESDPVIKGGNEKDGRSSEIAIEFKDVDFKYPGTTGKNVLSDISLTVKKGETLAVIGATGSGKSSLISLIPRYYDAAKGKVYIEGRDIAEYDLPSLRKKIGYVMQKSELFSDTIANNIKWGKDDATDGEIREAAAIAQADSFVNEFTEGYDTFIAEKGASLSGGQKQRLSIARAIVRRPEILILDDATSALDLATEAKLQTALREAMKDTTVVMVAQRIASVRHADRIAVIESDGRILHCAPHEELLKISETYRDICASQRQNVEGGAK